MGIGRYIQKRGDAYRFRARLPQGIVACAGRSEIVAPLAARDRRTALRRARVLRVALEALVARLSAVPQLTSAEAEALVRAWIDRARDALDRDLAAGRSVFFSPDEFDKLQATMPQAAHETDVFLRFMFQETFAPELKSEIRNGLNHGLAEGSDLASCVGAVRQSIAPDLVPASDDGRLLARTILRGVATLIDERLSALRGDLAPIPAAAELPRPTAPKRVAPFLAAWERFAAAKRAEAQWTEATARNSATSRALFEGLVANGASIAASGVTGAVVPEFRLALLRFPKFYDKDARFMSMPLSDQIAAANTIDAKPEASERKVEAIPRVSLKTADKHFSNLSEYFRWLQKTDHINNTCDNSIASYVKK